MPNCSFHSLPIKYTCPSCNVKSCSLQCINRHKLETKCTGKRKIEFVEKRLLKDHMQSDHNFMQQIGDSITMTKAVAKRSFKKRPIKKIMSICERFKIHWKASPLGLSAGLLNKTYLKDESVYWSVLLKDEQDTIIHNINGLESLQMVLQRLKYDNEPLVYVYQHISNAIHSQKKWTNIPAQRFEDSFFHILSYGLLPGEFVIIHEMPEIRIKAL